MSSVKQIARSGRPRDQRVDGAISEAALALMAEHGVAELRMDAVAERAGVGKAAIYRRFRSKDELVASVIGELVNREIAIPDTGSTERDLRVLMDEAVSLYQGRVAGSLVPALIEAIRRDPQLARTVREDFLPRRRAALAEVVRRGIERGDLDPELDLELTLDLLAGPLFYRLLITGGPLDDRLAAGVVELILDGNRPAHRSRPWRRSDTHAKKEPSR